MVIAHLLSHGDTSNKPVMVSIISTNFKVSSLFFPILAMLQEPITYTQHLFHGISSSNLPENLP